MSEKTPHRVLIASQPRAWRVLEAMLRDVAVLVPAHTPEDACRILESDRIDLIIATIASTTPG